MRMTYQISDVGNIGRVNFDNAHHLADGGATSAVFPRRAIDRAGAGENESISL